MQREQLELELRAILTLEERNPCDWDEVETRCLDLFRRLLAEGAWTYPTSVSQYIDDADIRRKDAVYAQWQREKLQRWFEGDER